MQRRIYIACIALLCSLNFTALAEDGTARLENFANSTRIEEITIGGNFPFLSRQIRRQLSIRPGDIYDESVLPEQLTRIREFYQRKGYFNTEVTVRPQLNEDSHGMEVAFHIQRGESLRWGEITVTGDQLLRRGQVRSAYSQWASYTPKRLRSNARRIASMLHGRGYIRARVRVTETRPDLKRGRMDVTLHVTSGPKIDIVFAGNERLSTPKLRQALTFKREQRFDRFEIEASVKALTALYRKEGYPQAEITFTRNRHDAKHTTLTFHIEEEQRKPIWEIAFSGNTHFSDGELRPHILTHAVSLGSRGGLDEHILNEDLRALEELYRRAGFLKTEIGPATIETRGRFFEITIPIVEGPQYRVGRIAFTGNFHAGHETLMTKLAQRPGKPIKPHAFEEDRQSLQLYFEDHGHPYVEVTQQLEFEHDTSLAHLQYNIRENAQARIGDIAITGDFLTSQRAIFQALAIQSGDLYSDQKIQQSKRNLSRLGVFRNIHIERIGLEDLQDTIHLAIRVEEERPYQIDFDLGYTSDDLITGGVKFVNNNAFGWAKRAQFSLLGGQEHSRGELSWIDPRLFGKELVLSSSVFLDRNQDVAYDLIQAGGNVGLYRQYHRTGFSLQYELARNRLLGGSSTVAASQGRRDSSNSVLTAGISFDTRDRFSQPTRGWYLFANTDLFNEIGGQRADFVKIRSGVSHYLHLYRGIILSQHGRYGHIQSLGAANIPITERFFLGGEESVRGFSEDSLGPTDGSGNPLGGEIRWIYNAELSAPIYDGIRIAGFFDMGSLTNNYGDITKRQIREALGIGLRYITPVGPLRIDYAFKLNREAGESTGRFHFTFGHIF